MEQNPIEQQKNKIDEAAAIGAREIYNVHYLYTHRYYDWITTYRRYAGMYPLVRPFVPHDYSKELGDLLAEMEKSLSDFPLFIKGTRVTLDKKERNKWDAVEKTLSAIKEGLRIPKATKSVLELLRELPDISTYLYARAVTKEEEAQLNKFKEEIAPVSTK